MSGETDPVAGIDVFTVSLPLADPFQHASSGLIDRLDEVVVRVRLASGAAGWGEVRGNAPYVTGETQGRIVAALVDLFAPRVVEARPDTPLALKRLLAGVAVGNVSARAALSIAAEDAFARGRGLSVQAALGAGGVRRVPVHGTVPFCPPEDAGQRARDYLDRGVLKIKQRIGLSAEEDAARMEAIRAAVDAHPRGASAVIGADANQALGAKEAVTRLRRLVALGLAFVEQPVPAADLAGLKAVRDAVDIPVFADESAGTAADLMRLVDMDAVDGVHLKLVKAGGIRPLMDMVAIAEAAGLAYLMGQMDEGMLATAAALHCAAASRPFSCELWGYQRVATQPFTGIGMEDGAMILPDAPGLGVDVDEAALHHVASFGDTAP